MALAARTGRFLAERGIGVVYGGGRVGLMGAVADAALARGGDVIGVIPRSLAEREIAHPRLSELLVVETMHERKAGMAARADAFLALPGGVGTLEEIFETITWRQLGIHDKASGFLDADGFWHPLHEQLARMERDGLLKASDRASIVFGDDLATVVERLLDPTSRDGVKHWPPRPPASAP